MKKQRVKYLQKFFRKYSEQIYIRTWCKKDNKALYSYRASYYMGNNVIFGFLYSFAFDSSDRVFAGDLDHVFYVDNLVFTIN